MPPVARSQGKFSSMSIFDFRFSDSCWNETGMCFRMSAMRLMDRHSIPDWRERVPKGQSQKQTQPNPLSLNRIDSKTYLISDKTKPTGIKSFDCNYLARKKRRISRNTDQMQNSLSPIPKTDTGLKHGNSKLEIGKSRAGIVARPCWPCSDTGWKPVPLRTQQRQSAKFAVRSHQLIENTGAQN